jgi:dihydroorotate dehydrogenase
MAPPVMSRSIFRVRIPRTCANCSRTTALDALLGRLKSAQSRLADRHGRYVPLALKIAPDLEDSQIQAIADLLRQHRMDGVIATNTTLSRAAVAGLANAEQAGGLSGAPLRTMSNAVVKKLARPGR